MLPAFSAVVSGEVVGTGSQVRLPDVPCRAVIVQNRTGNSAAIAVGGTGVASITKGLVLVAGAASPMLFVTNLNQLYMFAALNDELDYIAFR